MDTLTLKQQVIYNIVGNVGTAMFISSYLLALIGFILSVLINTNNRNPISKKTPIEFKWEVFFCQNTKRVIINLLLIAVGILFYPKFFSSELSTFGALLLGFTPDRIVVFIKNATKNTKK